MNIDTLSTELAAGHPDTGAYDADARTAAEQINAKNRGRLDPIGSAELLAWSAGASDGDDPRLLKIETAAEVHVSKQVHALAKAALKTIERDETELDLTLPDRMALVDGLVAGGVLSAADKTSLIATSTTAISRAEELELPVIKPGHVIEARA